MTEETSPIPSVVSATATPAKTVTAAVNSATGWQGSTISDSDSDSDFNSNPGASASAEDANHSASRCRRAWRRFFDTQLLTDVPNMQRFAANKEVNLSFICKLRGIRNGGMLNKVMKHVKSLHHRKKDFNGTVRNKKEGITMLSHFVENAPEILAQQEKLREASGPKRKRKKPSDSNAPAAADGTDSSSMRGPKNIRKTKKQGRKITQMTDEYREAKIRALESQRLLNEAAAKKAAAEAAKLAKETELSELRQSLEMFRSLGKELDADTVTALEARIKALIGNKP